MKDETQKCIDDYINETQHIIGLLRGFLLPNQGLLFSTWAPQSLEFHGMFKYKRNVLFFFFLENLIFPFLLAITMISEAYSWKHKFLQNTF